MVLVSNQQSAHTGRVKVAAQPDLEEVQKERKSLQLKKVLLKMSQRRENLGKIENKEHRLGVWRGRFPFRQSNLNTA